MVKEALTDFSHVGASLIAERIMRLHQRISSPRTSNVVIDCIARRKRQRAVLCDLSEQGCRVELPDAQRLLGDTLVFEIDDRLAFVGEIVWTRGNEAGVEFSRPLSRSIRTALDLD